MSMTISQLAQSGRVGVETVRYYQRRGLIPDPKPTTTNGTIGRKHYGSEDTQRLKFIRSAKSAGFTLEEIGQLLALDPVLDRDAVRQLAQERVSALDQKIDQMSAARDALDRLSTQCAKGGVGACPIITAFEA